MLRRLSFSSSKKGKEKDKKKKYSSKQAKQREGESSKQQIEEKKNGQKSKKSDKSQPKRSKSRRSERSETSDQVNRKLGQRHTTGGDRIGWEYHNVTLSRVPGFGFGVAISGGRDNPHFLHGDCSIAISDVLKSGPAEGRLQINDRVVSANGISLENVDYPTAVQVLRECGNTVNLLVKRRIFRPPPSDILRVALTKKNKKDDFGIVLGCRIYIKEITSRSLIEKDASLQEGDVVLKINNTSLDNLSLKEAKKLIESCKEKLQLTVRREHHSINNNNSSSNHNISTNGNNNSGNNNSLTNNNSNNNSNSNNAMNRVNEFASYSIYENGTTTQAIMKQQQMSIDASAFIQQQIGNTNGIYIPDGHNNTSLNRHHPWSNQNVYVRPPTRGNSIAAHQMPPPPPPAPVPVSISSSINHQPVASFPLPPPPPLQSTNALHPSVISPYSTLSSTGRAGGQQQLQTINPEAGDMFPPPPPPVTPPPPPISTGSTIKHLRGMSESLGGPSPYPSSPAKVTCNSSTASRSSKSNTQILPLGCNSSAHQTLLTTVPPHLQAVNMNANTAQALNSTGTTMAPVPSSPTSDLPPPRPPTPTKTSRGLRAPSYGSNLGNVIDDEDVKLPLPPPPASMSSDMKNSRHARTRSSSGRHSSSTSATTTNVATLDAVPRKISFRKEGSVGIRLTGGNVVGIFVATVQPGSPASLAGLQAGDKILKVNKKDLKGFTREEAVLLLLSSQESIELLVQSKKEEYDKIVAEMKGDSFYIKTHFNYNSTTKGELSFHSNEVFHVTDTLYNGTVGSWQVFRVGRNNQEIQRGTIPNLTRAEEIATEQWNEKVKKAENSGRNRFFRRRSLRRLASFSSKSSSSGKFGYDDDEYNGYSKHANIGIKFPAYERVGLKHPGFIRPVVVFGPLADIARDKLLKEYPGKYAAPRTELTTNSNGDPVNDLGANEASPTATSVKNSFLRLSTIKEIIDCGKHAILDVTPATVDKLNYAQIYPIVIFMRAESKAIIKELRSRHSKVKQKSSRRLFERMVKLENHWSHVFTATIALTNADMWYKKLREIIERQQSQNSWIMDGKPDEIITDDFLFPLSSRMSYASSPESDLDITLDSKLDDAEDDDDNPTDAKGRLVKSSSDPSLAVKPGSESNNLSNGDSSNAKPVTSPSNNGSSNYEPSSQTHVPLHIQLRKELSRALKRGDSRLDKSTNHNTGASSSSSSSHVPPSSSVPGASSSHQCAKDDLDAEEYYGTPSKSTTTRSGRKNAPIGTTSASSALYSSPWMTTAEKNCINGEAQQESTYCNTPTGTFLPSSPFGKMSKVSATPTMTSIKAESSLPALTPPRVDRQSKPARFKSAYERLFGRSDTSPNKTTEFVFGGVQRANAEPSDDRVSFSRQSTTSPDYINSSQLCTSRSATESLVNSGSHYSSNFIRTTCNAPPFAGGETRESPPASSYGYSNSINGVSSNKQTSVKYQSFYSEVRRHEKINANSHHPHPHQQQQML